ncbi:MAG TPA: cytochrome c [Gemmatimonadaceae bacterium]|nr:cytochrome c [Gemmatimonadaceae bacterium]
MRRNRFGTFTATHLCLGLSVVASLVGCDWFTDFKRQPKMDPWETAADTIAMRGNPQMSVPIYGTAAPGFAYGRAPTHGAIDSMAAIANPVASDERSLREGHKLYAINCAVCHGDRGMADGPVVQFGLPVLPIGQGTKAATQYSDGYIFGIIRNGRGLMPPYNRIEERERWDLINYLRTLQSGAANVPVGPVGRPGETGATLPVASFDAPTRPVPFARPVTGATPAPDSGRRPSATAAPTVTPTPTSPSRP